MRFYPITLGVKRTNWAAAKSGKSMVSDRDEATQKVLERDKRTCRCCGFHSPMWQQVLHIDGDDNNFADNNVLTTCIFCHQCFDLQSASDMESGMLIWLPEFSQADLNNLMRVVYIARSAPGQTNALAAKVFDLFYARGEEARRRLGSTDPGALAIVMRDFLTKAQYEKSRQLVDGIRLLPLPKNMVTSPDGESILYNRYPTIQNHWRSKVFNNLPPQNWTDHFAAAAELVSDKETR